MTHRRTKIILLKFYDNLAAIIVKPHSKTSLNTDISSAELFDVSGK
jgi:hypothetical protein